MAIRLWRPSELPAGEPPPPTDIPCVLRRVGGAPARSPNFSSESEDVSASNDESTASSVEASSAGPFPFAAWPDPNAGSQRSSRQYSASKSSLYAQQAPKTMLPINAPPDAPRLLAHTTNDDISSALLLAAPHATFSLPGMQRGKQYIQVVDLLPEHMPPAVDPDDDSETEEEEEEAEEAASSRKIPTPKKAPKKAAASAEADYDAVPTKKPSDPDGAWKGRTADEVIEAQLEAEHGKRLGSMADFISRLERQADALEIEMGRIGDGVDAVDLGWSAHKVGVQAGLMTRLGKQVESAVQEHHYDLAAVNALGRQLEGLKGFEPSAAASPRKRAGTPGSGRPGSAGRPGFGSSTPRLASGGRGRGGSAGRGGGRSTAVSAARGRGRSSTTTTASKPPLPPPPPAPAAAPPPPASPPPPPQPEPSSSISRTKAVAEPPAAAASTKPEWDSSAAAAPDAGLSNKRPAATSATAKLTRKGGSGGAAAVKDREQKLLGKRSALVGANEMMRASAEKQRQGHMDKRMARAEATLHKLLGGAVLLAPTVTSSTSGLPISKPSAGPPSKIPTPRKAGASSSSAASPRKPTPTGAGSATKIPTPSKSGAPAESSAETAAAELPRRQQIAAKLEKEAGLLDAIISTVPTVDGVEPPTTVLHLEEMK